MIVALEQTGYGRALRGLGVNIPNTGNAYGFEGSGSTPSGSGTTSSECPRCPSNCTTTQKTSTYYARSQKTSENDIPIVMNVKSVNCTPPTTKPQMACEREAAEIKARNGISGLSGCSACSGDYSNRM